MEEKDILLDNVKKFLRSAETIYNDEDFTSATILYFKALFSAFDLIILNKTGKIPQDHSERFRILEKVDHRLYTILDKFYPTYRSTYNSQVDKQTCNKLKENVERIIKEQGIFKDNQ